jgi:hypothetical protein
VFAASAGTKEWDPCWASPLSQPPSCTLCHHPHDFHVELMRGMKVLFKSRASWLRLVLNMRQIHLCQTAILTNSITEPAVHARSVSSTCKCRLVWDKPPLPFAYQNRFWEAYFWLSRHVYRMSFSIDDLPAMIRRRMMRRIVLKFLCPAIDCRSDVS